MNRQLCPFGNQCVRTNCKSAHRVCDLNPQKCKYRKCNRYLTCKYIHKNENKHNFIRRLGYNHLQRVEIEQNYCKVFKQIKVIKFHPNIAIANHHFKMGSTFGEIRKLLNINNFSMKIAFGHKMRVGKDAACSYLARQYGGNVVSFSAPIYDILKYASNVCNFEFKKDREFLQYVGTWAKKTNRNVWIDAFLSTIASTSKSVPDVSNVFNADLRFENEMTRLKECGWCCVKINRTNLFKQVSNESTDATSHESEHDLDDYANWDYIINNNGTLLDFYEQIDKIVYDLKMKFEYNGYT